jgi:hypothetical protein
MSCVFPGRFRAEPQPEELIRPREGPFNDPSRYKLVRYGARGAAWYRVGCLGARTDDFPSNGIPENYWNSDATVHKSDSRTSSVISAISGP